MTDAEIEAAFAQIFSAELPEQVEAGIDQLIAGGFAWNQIKNGIIGGQMQMEIDGSQANQCIYALLGKLNPDSVADAETIFSSLNLNQSESA